MASTAEDVLDRIREGKIDKQDALRKFHALSEPEKYRVVSGLKSHLHAEGKAGAKALEALEDEDAQRLTPVREADLTPAHKQFIEDLARRFVAQRQKSKENAEVHQKYFVDQRKVAGLKRVLKPMQFQLTYDRAEGAYLYDVDGHQYVDITGDNGVNFFGHQPEFIKQALTQRLNQGYPLVAYSEDLFESARLFCEITGHERMVYAQTGTEAVMWAVRLARAATGKKKVVIFDGSYHGLSDTVLAMRGRNGTALSAGLGLLQEFADQLCVLDYGDMATLDFIEQHADDIACVLTEPVQSRFPARQPIEYVRELRRITLEHGIVLIFDEMVTGFRAGTKGAESFYKVKPDLSIYGKVPGGGLPTGIVAGLSKYLDYVDGGVWHFDDDSMPSLKRAVMAGTHTQNSLKVSATLAVCKEMKRLCNVSGGCEYGNCTCAIGALNRRTEALCDEINAYAAARRVPLTLEYFSSLFRIAIADDPYGVVRELLIALLKSHGVETSVSGNNFLNLAHSDDDVRWVVDAFKKSMDVLLEQKFFHESDADLPRAIKTAAAPARVSAPAPSARHNADEWHSSQINRLKEMILADLHALQGKDN